MERDYTPADHLLMRLQQGLSLLRAPATASRRNPARQQDESELPEPARRHAAGLMRVNHAGEVAAQALYQGQALTARNPRVREHLLDAAREEQDHLHWCEERLSELGDAPSKLRPLWYAGSFAIGAVAGLSGDRWSLGFVAETEKQVAEHLDEHLHQLPEQDRKSRSIVEAMHSDETRHGQDALAAGGKPLPQPVRALMKRVAQVMKFGAYRF
ncbi:MAG TPA: 2-polyprenyl-3-methyl-6-methoxy-1,4-benzoquinone monooxygenase [Stenotrophobium sp.]|jgi:ubiquinone biosynthesis monooxygenase Coq7|nr:2-polyprenyl-3-methyl-6-methoxy-1,4-benzoquinone monooxygenase [Stenotrophobium sp.]